MGAVVPGYLPKQARISFVPIPETQSTLNAEQLLQRALDTARKEFGVEPILTAQEIADIKEPDYLGMMAYVARLQKQHIKRQQEKATHKVLEPKDERSSLSPSLSDQEAPMSPSLSIKDRVASLLQGHEPQKERPMGATRVRPKTSFIETEPKQRPDSLFSPRARPMSTIEPPRKSSMADKVDSASKPKKSVTLLPSVEVIGEQQEPEPESTRPYKLKPVANRPSDMPVLDREQEAPPAENGAPSPPLEPPPPLPSVADRVRKFSMPPKIERVEKPVWKPIAKKSVPALTLIEAPTLIEQDSRPESRIVMRLKPAGKRPSDMPLLNGEDRAGSMSPRSSDGTRSPEIVTRPPSSPSPKLRLIATKADILIGAKVF